MRATLNGKEIVIPSSLSEFKLGERIRFQEEVGNDLDEMVKAIVAIEDEFEKSLQIAEFQVEKMFRTMAFFCNCTVEALKESDFVDDIAGIYYASCSVLFEDEQKMEPQTEYTWMGETWVLHPVELKQDSKMKFGEFVDAKQMIKDLHDLGNGHWEKLLNLCVIFLRKENEPYQESFMYENSERINLMKNLPLDIALGVGFFLTGSLILFMSISQFSLSQESKEVESKQLSTSNAGAG